MKKVTLATFEAASLLDGMHRFGTGFHLFATTEDIDAQGVDEAMPFYFDHMWTSVVSRELAGIAPAAVLEPASVSIENLEIMFE